MVYDSNEAPAVDVATTVPSDLTIASTANNELVDGWVARKVIVVPWLMLPSL